MQSLNISTSALRGIQQALDTSANNMSNMDTVGYKRRVASFSELLVDSMNEQPATDQDNRNSPVGIRVGSGARLGMTRLDMGQGSMKQTDVPTDLMIQGEGYFRVGSQVNDANGVRVEDFRLTRHGSFHLEESDYFGGFVLVAPSGHVLLNESDSPIVLPTDDVRELVISEDGYLTVNGEPLFDRVGVWKVHNPDMLKEDGDNLLSFGENIGSDPGAINPDDLYELAWTNNHATIRQGALEASNVNLQEEMSQLINIQRAYQLNSRAIAISDQIMGIATSIRSR
jgi:flagellar basal-body rod protein FlgG